MLFYEGTYLGQPYTKNVHNLTSHALLHANTVNLGRAGIFSRVSMTQSAKGPEQKAMSCTLFNTVYDSCFLLARYVHYQELLHCPIPRPWNEYETVSDHPKHTCNLLHFLEHFFKKAHGISTLLGSYRPYPGGVARQTFTIKMEFHGEWQLFATPIELNTEVPMFDDFLKINHKADNFHI